MPSAPPTPAPRTRPADSALRHRLVVYLDAETLAKLERAWALLSRGSRTKIDFALVLEKSVEAYLKDHCPVERDSRRRQRQEKKRGSSSASKRSESTRKVPSAPPAQSTPPRVAARRARRIPAAVRDSVYLRDGGVCTFVSADGRRCGSTTGVEIDHWEPVARGGTNAIANLRCLCRAHNQYEADRVLGKSFMNSKRRRQGAARTERHSSIGTDGGPAPGTSEDICRGRFTPNAGENGSAMDPTN